MLATLPVVEVQRRTGRTIQSIITRRCRLKRQGVEIADQRTSAEKGKVGKSVWTPAADNLVRKHRPFIAAHKLGVSDATVHRRRRALGLPPIGYPPRKPKPPRKRPPLKRWSKAELQIALSMPPREAVKRLPGRSLSAIETVRCLRKRAGVKFDPAKPPGRPRGTKNATIHRHNGR